MRMLVKDTIVKGQVFEPFLFNIGLNRKMVSSGLHCVLLQLHHSDSSLTPPCFGTLSHKVLGYCYTIHQIWIIRLMM